MCSNYNQQHIQQLITKCLLSDRKRFLDRLRSIDKRNAIGKPIDLSLDALKKDIQTSIQRKDQRAAGLPKPDFPQNLPVVAMREELRAAIAEHQVVIICGETGSGKTTQIPKICLELGRGIDGMIGHTQPRRIAARSLANRIAEELNGQVGGMVGFKIRFNDQVGPNSYLKIMTDGILLAETQSDPDLSAYDTLIIDEAHERSLNIDFLLGYLTKLLPRRPELKLIITSATINPEQFSKHFNNAPIIQVSGRTHPVEILYRPIAGLNEDEKDRDRGQALLDAVDELAHKGPGDILIFLAGEREIRETAELLRKHHPPSTEILPLYGRLSIEQQNRVFQSHKGRRVVLATNVAETSLTVPGIRYVVDAGMARISRYSYRTKVQRLPIESISQASAKQRTGRCGRVAAGICIRLYSEEDFQQRSEFTDAEIQRTNLATVILQMLALKLGDIHNFPFIDPPDERLIKDGFKLLHELEAVDVDQCLTDLGHRLAKLPIDARLGRMILAAEKNDCLSEVIVIAAALAIQDPRERPLDKQQQADEKHAVFIDKNSDFMSYLNIWDFYQNNIKHLSQAKLRKLCQTHFLSYIRMREWSETVKQLRSLAKNMRLQFNQKEVQYDILHQALLTGLLSNILFISDEHEYTGARNLKLYIFPGSGLFKKKPKWIIAAEFVETAKRYARTVAKIEPEWVEPLAKHLIKCNCFDPHWEKRQGKVVAYEQISLYGLILVNQRKIDYSKINAGHARELFIRSALVHGEMLRPLDFITQNKKVAECVLQLEAKTRRQDIMIDEESLYHHFDTYLPTSICTVKQFEKWYHRAEKKIQQHFLLNESDYMQHDASTISYDTYPTHIMLQGLEIPLSYHFEPGHKDDGISAQIPLAALNQLNTQSFEWLIPGLLENKITFLIKSLPKSLRKNFVPAPDYAKACAQAIEQNENPLLVELASKLKQMTGANINPEDWQLDQLPKHLFMNFHLLDAHNKIIAEGRDVEKIKQEHGNAAANSFASFPYAEFQKDNLTTWDFGDLTESIEIEQQGMKLKGFPALVTENDKVLLRIFDDKDKAHAMHRQGVLQLFRIHAEKSIRYLEKNLPDSHQLGLYYISIGHHEDLKNDIIQCVLKTALFERIKTIRTQQEFQINADWAEKQLIAVANNVCRLTKNTLSVYACVNKNLNSTMPPQWLASLSHIREQLDQLIYPGFISNTPFDHFEQLPRYLEALNIRLNKLEQNPQRDRQLIAEFQPYWAKYKAHAENYADHPDLISYRWLLEEFRVSLFAQTLGTRQPISTKRLDKALALLKNSLSLSRL